MLTYVYLTLILVALIVVLLKVTVVERKYDELTTVILNIDESLRPSNKDSRYYAVCVCQKPNKQRSYFSFTTDDFIHGDPTETDLSILRQNVLNENPEFNSCEIIFFGKISST